MDEERIVKIGPLRYPVTRHAILTSDTEPYEDLAGNIRYAECEIWVQKHLDPQTERHVIWHEAIHGMLDHIGHHDVPEHIVDAFTFGALMLIDANPWMVRKWRRKDGQDCQE